MNENTIVAIVTALLTAGPVAALSSLITGRALARKTEAEAEAITGAAPLQREGIAIAGAERAVLTMSAALESAQERIGELTAQGTRDHLRIAELEQRAFRDNMRIAHLEERVRLRNQQDERGT